jgi:2',3'-cyclic-nucleotide 2'-phosphodiesterase (5'-nucleotidase family)
MTALICPAQTNPSAQTLPFSLTAQSGSALPAGVAVHKFTAIPTTRTTAVADADVAYNAGSNSGGWLDAGANGIGVLPSSSNPAAAVVVAVNTTGKTAIQVSWVCHTILNQASRDDSVALQYRVGTSGAFTDVGTTSTYTSLNKTPIDTSPIFTETLPIAAENQSVVQVRWIFWESNGSSGSRDRIAVDDISITGTTSTQTNPTAVASADSTAAQPGQSVVLTVTVTPGANPTSSGLSVTGDLSAIGGSATQTFSGAGNVFTYNATLPANLSYGAKVLNFSVTDAQARTANATLTLGVRGNVTIFHTNDTHARVTPHKWVIPQHSGDPQTKFEDVGGVAYVGAKVLSLATAQPDALVLDGGDISEGNPIGDWNGPPSAVGVFGNGTIVEYFKLLDTKLKAIPGRSGRGLDAMVVGNHDIRNITYLNNMKAASLANFPILSINICNKGTHTPYYQAYTIVNINGNKIGIIGYTTESADSSDTDVNAAIDVVKCDWSSTDSTKIHFADYVNDLRNNQGCTMVILLTHMGHSGLCTVTTANPTPILVDNAVAQVPEVVVSGHWHTYANTVWQPTSLNYKTIFTEAGSFTHYVSELRVNGAGQYIGNANYPIRDADITPDADIAALIQSRKDAYAATNPTYGVDQVLGYTADDLLLDNYMKWWSADEYPWSGDNTAGAWICDAAQWKAASLFGHCDLSLEAGGGVRSDIPAGPITYSQIYETFPWADDTIYMVKMTGAEIWNYFKQHGCDAAMSHGWFVTAYDGVPTSITYNGQPIDLAHQYDVAINNYMYLHDSVPFSDQNPQTSTYLARTALMDYTKTFTKDAPYSTGGPRYSLNTDFSGGYRAVVTMMNDADSKTAFDDAFIRFLSATPETLQHRGTKQVPTSLVNADGSFNPTDRLAEIELYRSYLGFKTGALHPGDIIETWGKGSFYQGDPEFVDQEGIQSNGVEFKIVGHDDSLAKPALVDDIPTLLDNAHKNHYVKILVKKTGASTVVDQNSTALTVKDVTGYSNKTLPGNTNDLLLLTGVPTSESFATRFRCDSAVLASTAGISSFPATSAATSHVDPVSASVTSAALTLTATTSVTPGNIYYLGPLADSQVSSGNPTTNSGTATSMFVQSSTTTASSFGDERGWAKFDLSSLPSGAVITSAQLQLYCFSAASAELDIAVAGGSSDSWTETGITWNTQPAFGSTLDTVAMVPGTTDTYSWDVTSFVQSKFADNKLVSLVAKPVVEGSTTTIGYRFDCKEFGSNAPVLTVTTATSGPATTVTQVQFYYRFSSDNAAWGAWTSVGTATTAPYSTAFAFPQGYGYYEFYSVATDSSGGVESAPVAAQTATHYTATPAYTTAAVVTLGNLSQTYNGAARVATATTVPPGLTIALTYDGSSTAPVNAGLYNVVATINQASYTGSATGTLAVAKINQTITFGALAPKTTADAPFALSGSASSGLGVTYTSSNPSVATVSGSTVTLVGPGTTTITADQVGNVNYYAAASVNQSLTVTSAVVPNGNSDVPAMPLWAIGALAAALFAIATRLLKPHRQQ